MDETKIDPTKNLTEIVRKLNSLLQNPEPGLGMWNMFLNERLIDLSEELQKLGYGQTRG
jgi:hypothetical protein